MSSFNEEMKNAAREMPIEAVRQAEKTIRSFFDEAKVPWNTDTLSACMEMTKLIHSGLPPIYGQFTAAMMLNLIRLLEELETGLIGSPIHVKKEDDKG